MPELSVIILSFNTRQLLMSCIEHVERATSGRDVEIIVVDNGSTDGSIDQLKQLGDRVRLVLAGKNLGFAGGNNLGIRHASGEYLILLNSDAFINQEMVDRALDLMVTTPRAGICGVRIDNPDGSVQAGPSAFPTLWSDIAVSLGLDQFARCNGVKCGNARRVDWVHGACLIARRTAVEQFGGLDTSFFMYSEEVEWCHRCWERGWQVWYLPDVSVIHLGGASSSANDLARRADLYRSRLKFRRQLGGRLSVAVLWVSMLAGLAARMIARSALQLIARRQVGRQTPRSDWRLLVALASAGPF